MASCYYLILTLPICLMALQGCENSSATDSIDRNSIATDSQSGLSADGAGVLADNGTQPPQVSPQPGDDPETIVPVGPEGDSSLEVYERSFPLDSALGDIWGVQGEHFNVNFTVTNGRFTIKPTQIDGETYNLLVPAEATAVIYAEMFSPGEQFSLVTYSYSSSGGDELAGNAFFFNAFVGFDIDRSGQVEEDEELAVLGGTIEFSGMLPDIELLFSLTLEHGLYAEGHYTGLFDFTNR